MIARERSNEEVIEEPDAFALPHTLERLGAERTVHLTDAHNETNIVAVIDANEVEGLDHVTNFHTVFVFHKRIIAKTTEKGNSKNPNRINNLRMRHKTACKAIAAVLFRGGG
jgi:hypothetical protein